MALGTCALVTLRVLSPRATLSLQVVFSLLSVAFMLGGYALAGVQGAAWGLALGSALKAAGAWHRVRRLPEHPPAKAPGPDERQEAAPA
jgi:Na+-driven multidrug efflux pump